MNMASAIAKTISEHLIMTKDIHEFITNSLVHFFNTAFGVNESRDDLSFEYIDRDFGNNIALNYKYKYGYLSFVIDGDNSFVHFHFYNSAIKKLNIPFETNNFLVHTDGDLSYKYAEFERNFDLRYNMKSASRLNVSHLVMLDRIENRFESNLFYGNDLKAMFTSKNYLSKHLNERYFKMDAPFRDWFTKFLILCDYNSRTFTDVFDNYATLISKINDHSNVIDLLNMFEKHYSDNLEDLEAKILVCSMNLI